MEEQKCKMDTIELIFIRRKEAKKEEGVKVRNKRGKYQSDDVP